MKFIFLGYDFAIDTVHRLLDDGHELLGIQTFPCDNIFNFNTQLHDLATSLSIPISDKKPDQTAINNWIEKGAEIFLAAGYLYKIPPIDENKACGINIHPARLPKGRGIMPLPHIILNAPEAAGITAHKIIGEIDAGDIIAQIPLTVSPDETVETLSTRIAMAMPDMVVDIVKNWPEHWQNAKPQNPAEATHFDAPDDTMRTINWHHTVAEIKTLYRAFGTFGLIFHINQESWVAYNLGGWQEQHTIPPGTPCHITPTTLTIAAKDGYITITKADKL